VYDPFSLDTVQLIFHCCNTKHKIIANTDTHVKMTVTLCGVMAVHQPISGSVHCSVLKKEAACPSEMLAWNRVVSRPWRPSSDNSMSISSVKSNIHGHLTDSNYFTKAKGQTCSVCQVDPTGRWFYWYPMGIHVLCYGGIRICVARD